MKRVITIIVFILIAFTFSGCDETSSEKDVRKTLSIGDNFSQNQPTPNDVYYSLERYNLIRRTYWVNGQREKANSLLCPIQKPLGYILLFSPTGTVIGNFIVDGKVSSLRSYLTPDSQYYEGYDKNGMSAVNRWLPDVDGAYGENPDGIFFFTTDGNYFEWVGSYLYSDIPFEIDTLLNFEK